MTKDLQAQIVHGPLAGVFGGVSLDEQKYESQEHHTEIGRRHQIQAVDIAVHNVAIDGDLGNVRTQQLRAGVQQKKSKGDRQGLPIRTQIAQDPRHQAGIVSLAQDLFFSVKVRGHALSSC